MRHDKPRVVNLHENVTHPPRLVAESPLAASSEQGRGISEHTKPVCVSVLLSQGLEPLCAALRSPPSALLSRGRAYAGALTCSVSVLLFLPPLSCSFPFAVVCPEKEVKFQRAPNGEPCLPTHLPTPCCLCPPASHANPFCHVRVLHSSSLHVCAVWAGVARPAGRGPLPKVSQ